jgi:hypothetical protein
VRAHVGQRAVRVSTARFRLRPRPLLQATAADAAAAGYSSQLSPHSLGCSKPRGPPSLTAPQERGQACATPCQDEASARQRTAPVVSGCQPRARRWRRRTRLVALSTLADPPLPCSAFTSDRSPQAFAAPALTWFARLDCKRASHIAPGSSDAHGKLTGPASSDTPAGALEPQPRADTATKAHPQELRDA